MSATDSHPLTNDQSVWKAKVLDELKKQGLTEHFEDKIENIIISIEDGLSYLNTPISAASNTSNNDWNISTAVDVQEEKESNTIILQELMNGSDSLFIMPQKASQNWSELFKGIEFKYITTHIQITSLVASYSLNDWYTDEPNFFIIVDFASINNTADTLKIITNSKIPVKIKIDGFALQQCGANSEQELAYVIDQLHEILLLLEGKTNAKFQLNIGVGNNFMIEIAKFRALKELVKTLLTSYDFPINSFEIISEIGWTNKSLKDPNTNQLRQTTEALSAVIGGIDYLLIHPYDKKSKKGSSSLSRRMALNISSILKEESYLKLVKDAYRGSFYIENLSDKIGNGAWSIFKQLESKQQLQSPEKTILINRMILKTVEIRINEFKVKKCKLIGMNAFQSANTEDNNWEKETLFLGMETFRYEKILDNEKA